MLFLQKIKIHQKKMFFRTWGSWLRNMSPQGKALFTSVKLYHGLDSEFSLSNKKVCFFSCGI